VVSLPKAEAGASPEEPALVPEKNAARAARILVIDDEPAIAELLRDVLAIQGHSVEMTLSARAGVGLATTKTFDLVITDLGMPELSGWEVAAAIRAVRPEQPIVLVTGWAATIEEEQLRRHNIAAMIHKPFEISEVAQVTAGILCAGAPAAAPASVPASGL
jgi:DNA-binding response OmpR family regulator